MDYTKLIGYGIVIWVAAYLVATAFVGYGAGDLTLASVTTTIVVAVVTYALARRLHERSLGILLLYAAGWVVIGLLLDLLLTISFTGWEFFRGWGVWTGYAVLVIATLIAQEGLMGGRRHVR